MPDGSKITSSADRSAKLLDAAEKSNRLFALIAALREVENKGYEYADGVHQNVIATLTAMAFEEAQELEAIFG